MGGPGPLPLAWRTGAWCHIRIMRSRHCGWCVIFALQIKRLDFNLYWFNISNTQKTGSNLGLKQGVVKNWPVGASPTVPFTFSERGWPFTDEASSLAIIEDDEVSLILCQRIWHTICFIGFLGSMPSLAIRHHTLNFVWVLRTAYGSLAWSLLGRNRPRQPFHGFHGD